MVGFRVSSCYPTSFHHICFVLYGEQITCSGGGNCMGLLLKVVQVAKILVTLLQRGKQ